MFFNPKKSACPPILMQKSSLYNYKIADTQVLTNSSHKNPGIIISSDLSWDQHYKNIIPKTYRMLGPSNSDSQENFVYFLSEITSYILFSDL